MKFILLKQIIREADVFCSQQYLKLNKNAENKTFMGGLISLMIFLIILIVFFTMTINTFRKDKIYFTKEINIQALSSFLNVTTGSYYNFMIGITLENMNLTNNNRTYDIILSIKQFKNNQYRQKKLQLQQCRQQHWSSVSQSIWPNSQNKIKQNSPLDPSKWLCISLNQLIQLYGSQYTQQYSFLQIKVTTCNSMNDQYYSFNSSCAFNLEQNKNYLKNNTVNLQIFYIDERVNPSQKQPVKYFVKKSSGMSIQYGRQKKNQKEIISYQLSTDDSLLPFDSIVTKKGIFFDQHEKVSNNLYSQNSFLLTYKIQKSKKNIIYNRQIYKITSMFSEIGGLIGFLIVFVSIFQNYTNFSNQVAISSMIFKQNIQQKQKSIIQQYKRIIQPVTIFSYLKYLLYKFSKSIFRQPFNWPKYKFMQQYLQQINNHLEISNILNRIVSLEFYVINMYQEENQIQNIKKYLPVDIQNIKYNRCLLNNKKQKYKKKQIFKIVSEKGCKNQNKVYKRQNLIKSANQQDQIMQKKNYTNNKQIGFENNNIYFGEQQFSQNKSIAVLQNNHQSNRFKSYMKKIKHVRQATKHNSMVVKLQSNTRRSSINQIVPVNFQIQSIKSNSNL